jgi:hypothetical protein
MNTRALITRAKPHIALWAALLLAQNSFAYQQATTGTYAGGNPGVIEKSATAAPNDAASFTSAVSTAYAGNIGGVADFPTATGTSTIGYTNTYGPSNAKRVVITPSVTMQDITAGTFVPTSGAHGITSKTDASGYNLAIAVPTDGTTGATLLEAVVQIGVTVLSRNNAAYPLDIRATASFADGTSQSVTTNVNIGAGVDDTFFGFTAPSGTFITNIALASFSPGTTTPVANRIGLDDIGFITASTVPPPEVRNTSPFNYAIAKAANGVSFNAYSFVAVPAAGISMKLNSVDVTSQLVIGGTDTDTNRTVTYSGLVANQTYDLQITVSNSVGVTTANSRFYTYDNGVTIFDSGGFSDTAVYSIGPLQASTNNGCVWVPPVDAATIWDTGDPLYGPALKETQMGIDQTTYLRIPPVASGILRIGFDAQVSEASVRTLDMGINQVQLTRQGSFISWGTVANQVAYYNGTAWVGIAVVDNGWHHYEFLNYLSGSSFNRFDLYMDGTKIGNKLIFRTIWDAQAPAGNVRFGTINATGSTLQYGTVDNLVVTVGPLASPLTAVTLTNVSCTSSACTFSFHSQLGATHVVERSATVAGGGWGDWMTILGDGTIKTVTDTNLVGTQYYRVRSQ